MTSEEAGLLRPHTTTITEEPSGEDTPTFEKLPFRMRQSVLALALGLLPYVLAIGALYLSLRPLAQWLNSMGIAFLREDLTFFAKGAHLILALELCRRYFNRLYLFDRSGITEQCGILSTSYRSSRVQYKDIRELKVEQGVIGRILGFGTVKLSTASTNGYEVILRNIISPLQLAACICPTKKGSIDGTTSSQE